MSFEEREGTRKSEREDAFNAMGFEKSVSM
jgi:hypothetical protein